MLTEPQAHEIVRASIGKVVGPAATLTADLRSAGITESKLNAFVKTLVADPQTGVPRYQHYLDPNIIGSLRLETSIADLTREVMKLSAGKLCSNPANPHPQTCCPYPPHCPQCGYPVL